MSRRAGIVRAVTLLGLTLAYVAAGKLGLSLALVHASASAVWPPTGIALAAFLLLGRSAWPAILVGSFLVNVTTAGNVATSLAIAVGNTLEGAAGAWLVRRYAGGAHAFERPRDAVSFVVLAGLVATTLSPSIGVTSLCVAGFADWSEHAGIWLTWWLGDAGGAVVVAPALILWAQRPRPGWTPRQRLEAGALGAAIAFVGAVAFGGLLRPFGGGGSLGFLCLPLTIWAAFRFGPRETAAAVLILSGMAVAGTLRGARAFAGGAENESLVLLQLFMGVVSATSLSLAAVVNERRRTLETLARQAAELARSNAELDRFAHVVSHDLKAPLRGISSLAAWVAGDCKDLLPEASRQHLALLEERARRMRRLIDGVLEQARVRRRPAELESVDSRAIVAEVIDSLGPFRGVSPRIEGRLPVVSYDAIQLARVFQNLIENAILHLGRPTGEVVVSCREAPAEFEFSVRDDGAGIPEAELAGIFKLGDGPDASRGTRGVGLAIVKKIVELHGGKVDVESAPGRGTCFRFTIPRRPDPGRERGSGAPDAPRRGTGARAG